ncbi:threonine synthase [Candidatus Methylomirabilis sp.]|uniref:Threonine synthase n=1 Tax=Candidatus Methylomirabilis tolerans TaxID=3123416 RepID=A0AAJ1ETP2_9BACT|nr:threonine synthase [Candidatus Methylomirabilis sp.]
MRTMSWKGIIDRYRAFLPVIDRTPVITLGEGNTPLIRVERLRAVLGIEAEVYVKYEGLNPTGSFKDRGMTLAISKAVEEGARAVICASTGNTSASASAYAARAGLRAFVLIPEGKIALGKLAQAMIHGAQVLQIEGNFDEALQIVRRVASDQPIVLVNSVNPYRIEGQKSAAFEICDRLGRSPDYHFIPVGNAGNITAYWKGYQEYFKAGQIASLPKMMGWQAEGAAPIVLGKVVEQPETLATAIRIGNPASWNGAVVAATESGGRIDMVSDSEIIDAYCLLAKTEGVFCELASAASVAGLIKYHRSNRFPKDTIVVCVLTGHGLKEPDAAIRLSQQPLTVKADPEAVLKLLSL